MSEKPTNPSPATPPSSDAKKPSAGKPPVRKGAPPTWLFFVLVLGVLLLFSSAMGENREEIPYSFFHEQVAKNNVRVLTVEGQQAYGEFIVPPTKSELEAARLKEAQEAETAEETKPEAEPSTTPESTESDSTDSASQPSDENPESSASDESAAESEAETADEASTADSESTSTESSDQSDTGDGKSATDGEERINKEFVVTLMSPWVENSLTEFWLAHNVKLESSLPTDLSSILYAVWVMLLIGFMIGMWYFMRRTRDQMMGGGMIGGVTRSPARRYEASESIPVTFNDVAGLEGVKSDLQEVVDFLKRPEDFQKLGARVPKGVLLMGPPGTGKTLLAKAVAGEAGVPFFSISGSEFIQLFVGVGASRVRDLFKTAKAASPAILFIDEIDAVGRQRGAGLGGGHDEREQTLNQILSEMDGFTPTTSIIVMAATNRPDVLDPALLRPGRFDRHITVDRPSLEARKELFEVHTREMPLADDVDFDRLARATVGLTGADIRNLSNEAALWATRHDKQFINMEDFEYARDKVLMGPKRDDVMTEHERKLTAYHEAGHTIVAWKVAGNDRVHKVTIIPRGRAAGVTQLVPEADRHNMGESDMLATLAMALGGRTAEKIVFDEYSTGAESDLKRATELARRMVTLWGMSERLGPVAFQQSGDNPFLGREIVQEHRHYSEHTAQVIDEEVAKVLHSAADRARRCLMEYHSELVALSEALLEREELNEAEIGEILGPVASRDRDQRSISIAPGGGTSSRRPST
ncbi:ATP-dependent zinc metalloprotease FtsH [Aeoliella mucimassa]|uniref:ATP-dependent zinc metalloprotease FtsH n=1 Tax=Aeoliella mucimassa TaxID=2527972 RepID=A0A518ASY6_9BACT|nr:ATP-dependent zinc metalloprotease FtsH [Aeoliella mucimassa]QDU57822.1 ATP-dependent zinc metalloprotease FtsH [Aeoliella mucimassa]